MDASVIIPDWPRPHFEIAQVDPQIFYVIVGADPAEGMRVSRARHHVDRLEETLQVSKHARADDPAWFDGWFSRPLGHGLDDVFADASPVVRSAAHLTVVRGTFADQPSLNYLRNTVGIVSAIVETGALAVFDVYALTWWRSVDWIARFVNQSRLDIHDHISIPVTDDQQHHPGLWTHTRGMIKFGRPEVQMKHLPGAYDVSNPAIRDSGRILAGIADYLAKGALIIGGQPMRLPSFDTTVTFIEEPDDSQTHKHFNNASLEIRDYDPVHKAPAPDAAKLLEHAARLSD